MELAYIWSALMRIRRRTASGFDGAEPITLQSIDTFSRLSGLRIAPWEVKLIEDLDDIYLASQAEKDDETPSES